MTQIQDRVQNDNMKLAKAVSFIMFSFFKTGAVDSCVFKSVENMNESFLISFDMVTADLSLEMFWQDLVAMIIKWHGSGQWWKSSHYLIEGS